MTAVTPSPAPVVPRSILVVPGADARKIAKAADAPADEVVFDLEDAVTPEYKTAARSLVADRLRRTEGWSHASVAVRINAVGTPWFLEDLHMLVTTEGLPRTVVIPKVDDAECLRHVARCAEAMRTPDAPIRPPSIQALIESSSGVVNVVDIARSGGHLTALIIGYADLAVSMGRPSDSPSEIWRPIQDDVLLAARVAGIAAIDGPCLRTVVDQRFCAEVSTARTVGFDGKWVIHPGQLATVNEAFTPSSGEIAYARAVLHCLDVARAAGRGAAVLEGRMLDEALALAARRTLAAARQ